MPSHRCLDWRHRPPTVDRIALFVARRARRGGRTMMVANNLFRWVDRLDTSPWGAVAGRCVEPDALPQRVKEVAPLYTPDQRRRRDESPWTIVQGVLAPVQFLVFLISAGLVVRFVLTGQGLQLASWSVVVKTGFLYTIMVTGAIWENEVFGRYLFAPAFFWEDAFSMLVIALHTLYIIALFGGLLAPHTLMFLALSAYASYVINAAQFVMKLRAARLQSAGYPA